MPCSHAAARSVSWKCPDSISTRQSFGLFVRLCSWVCLFVRRGDNLHGDYDIRGDLLHVMGYQRKCYRWQLACSVLILVQSIGKALSELPRDSIASNADVKPLRERLLYERDSYAMRDIASNS